MPDLRNLDEPTCIPDWSREALTPGAWDPGRSLLSSIRRYQCATGMFALVKKKIAVLQHRFWSAISGADIPLNAHIGGGLLIPHPNGIVIHPDAKIGNNCLIFQQVTIGTDGRGLPSIGHHVDIGAGAKLIGPISVGDYARIGANALVRSDVPNFGIVVAPEGKLIQRKDDRPASI